MIGSGLKKLAKENGMKVAHGVAYGSLQGFAATLSEGNGYKQIVFTTKFPEPAKADALQAVLNGRNITREFRVQKLNLAPNGILVVFHDNPGTMKKIRAFLDWFIPLLKTNGASDVYTCCECGAPVTGGCWKLIDGVAFYMHESCAEHVRRELAEDAEIRKQDATGSYVTGLIGALLGSAVGAVLWAIVLNLGYVASIVGFAIGWLAEKGYGLLKGKQGKAKVLILILAVIFGVLLGNFAADAITLARMISEGEMYGMAYADIPALITFIFMEDAEYRSATIGNILMGLLFAGLGVFTLLRKAVKEVADVKYIDLE